MINDLIGAPYELGGRDAATGIDCWGVVMYVYKKLGREIPDYWSKTLSRQQIISLIRQDQAAVANEVDTPKQYDLVVDIKKGHIGVWVNGKVLHASKEFGVKLETIDNFRQLYPAARFYQCH